MLDVWIEDMSDQPYEERLAFAEILQEALASSLEAARDLCCNLRPFFEMVKQNIKHHNSTDFDNIEFLVKAAEAEVHRLSTLIAGSSRKGGAA